ncbi:MAG: hypothetical protein PHQ36_08045 [Anaerolineales bacterium]|nr:hypothetical protein [Anaerolineales bacterium]
MNMSPEIMAELHRKDINEEIKSIRLADEAVKGRALLDKSLAAIGKWMILRGERLRQRYQSVSDETALELSHKAA